MNFEQKDIGEASSTDLVRNLQKIKTQLERAPVQITSHARKEFVLVSQAHFEELMSRVDGDSTRVETKLDILMESVDDFVVLIGSDLRFRRVNKAFCDFFNVDAGEVKGVSIEDLPRNPNDTFLLNRVKAVLESGRSESFEVSSTFRKGRLLQAHIRPWPGGVAMFVSDVTEQLYNKCRTNRDIAGDAALAALPGVGWGMIRSNGQIQFAGSSLATIVGTNVNALTDISLFSIIHRDGVPDIKNFLARSDLSTKVFSATFLRGGEDRVSGFVSLSPYCDEHGVRMFAMAVLDPAAAACATESCRGTQTTSTGDVTQERLAAFSSLGRK